MTAKTNELEAAFDATPTGARLRQRAGDLRTAFARLGRAHVLGQQRFGRHQRVHARMLRVGWAMPDGREVRGQLVRLLLAPIDRLIGRSAARRAGAPMGMCDWRQVGIVRVAEEFADPTQRRRSVRRPLHASRHKRMNRRRFLFTATAALALTDHTGVRRTLADYKGKLVVVFFGFTQCPDVCPTALSKFAEAKKRLGPDGDKLRAIFITIDPERDTQSVLAQYVPAFDPAFVGLYGTPAETEATAREFKVFYQKVPGKTPTSYTMDHTAGSYVFDTQGRIRLFLKHEQSAESIASDLRKLLG